MTVQQNRFHETVPACRHRALQGDGMKFDQAFYIGDTNIYSYQLPTGFKRWNTWVASVEISVDVLLP
jgi:hypothetical protein